MSLSSHLYFYCKKESKKFLLDNVKFNYDYITKNKNNIKIMANQRKL